MEEQPQTGRTPQSEPLKSMLRTRTSTDKQASNTSEQPSPHGQPLPITTHLSGEQPTKQDRR